MESQVNLLLGLLPGAVCIGGMYVCMRMMAGRGRRSDTGSDSNAEAPREVAALRDEVERLRTLVEVEGAKREAPR